MIRTLIIDDEEDACDNLESLLKIIDAPVHILKKIHDVPTAIESINTLKPDLLFLDIKLPTGNGFSILEKVHHKNAHIVFITAYDEFALKAFKYAAINYILKPINIADLRESIERVKSRLFKTDDHLKINTLIENQHLVDKTKKIVISTEHGHQLLELEQIVRLQSDGSYTHFYMNDGKKHTSSKILKFYADIISTTHFYRISRSHLINLEYVMLYNKGLKATVTLKDQTILEIARDKKEGFFNLIHKS